MTREQNLHLDVWPFIVNCVFFFLSFRFGRGMEEKKGVLPVLVHTYSYHKTLMKCTLSCFSAMLGTFFLHSLTLSFSLSLSFSSTYTVLFVENCTQSMYKCEYDAREHIIKPKAAHTTDKCQSLKSMKTCA